MENALNNSREFSSVEGSRLLFCVYANFLYMSCHNLGGFAIIAEEVLFMAKTVDSYIAELVLAYQVITQKTNTEVSLDFDVTLSNLYRYRKGIGNPRAKTIDKIIAAVEENCPQLLQQNRKEQQNGRNTDPSM